MWRNGIHYREKKENKFGMDELISRLENNLNVDVIFDLISSNVATWKLSKKTNLDLFSEFDKLIENDKQS